jgi:thiamine pyrophosphate-dependent acetolactate synthase large subunit-like protein
VTWLVFNNYGLGWEQYYQRFWLQSGKITGTKFETQPDFVKIAEANKCYGERVQNPSDVKAALSTFDFPEGFHEFHEIAWGKPVRPVEK